VAGFFGSPPMNFFEGMLAQQGPGFAFEETPTSARPLRFILNGTLANRAGGHIGKKVLLGLRPDNIDDKSLSPGSSSLPVSAMLERLEFRGGDTYAHLVRGKGAFVARLAGPAPAPKQPLDVHFDLSQAHLFDSETRARIA
jgi:multiple sugar transport system ATP-binding protein